MRCARQGALHSSEGSHIQRQVTDGLNRANQSINFHIRARHFIIEDQRLITGLDVKMEHLALVLILSYAVNSAKSHTQFM